MAIVNKRKYLNEYSPVYYSSESKLVPTTGILDKYYVVTLSEIPGEKPYVNSNLVVATDSNFSNKLSLVVNKIPSTGEFAIDGMDVYVSSSLAGSTIYARYYGIGSRVRAEHINDVKSDIVVLGSNISSLTNESNDLDGRLSILEGSPSNGIGITECEVLKLIMWNNFQGL